MSLERGGGVLEFTEEETQFLLKYGLKGIIAHIESDPIFAGQSIRDIALKIYNLHGVRARDVIGLPGGISTYPPITDELELLVWLIEEHHNAEVMIIDDSFDESQTLFPSLSDAADMWKEHSAVALDDSITNFTTTKADVESLRVALSNSPIVSILGRSEGENTDLVKKLVENYIHEGASFDDYIHFTFGESLTNWNAPPQMGWFYRGPILMRFGPGEHESALRAMMKEMIGVDEEGIYGDLELLALSRLRRNRVLVVIEDYEMWTAHGHDLFHIFFERFMKVPGNSKILISTRGSPVGRSFWPTSLGILGDKGAVDPLIEVLKNANKRESLMLYYIANKGEYSTDNWEDLNKYFLVEHGLNPVSQARLSQLTSKLLENKLLSKLEFSDNKFRTVKISDGFENFIDSWKKVNKTINANSRWSQEEKLHLQKQIDKGVKIADIAEELERSKSSVSSMLKRLAPELDDDKHELFHWRRKKAKEEEIAAFYILHDKAIQNIIHGGPTTFNELLIIEQIGWHKVKNYGNEILGIMNKDHTKWNSDIDKRIQDIESKIFGYMSFVLGKEEEFIIAKKWDEMEERERFELLRDKGAETKVQIRKKMDSEFTFEPFFPKNLELTELHKQSFLKKIVDGVIKEGYEIRDGYEIISAKIKGSRRLYSVKSMDPEE